MVITLDRRDTVLRAMLQSPSLKETEMPVVIETFAGDPTVNFTVKSIHVNGRDLCAFRDLGIPDLVDDFLFDGKGQVFGFSLSK